MQSVIYLLGSPHAFLGRQSWHNDAFFKTERGRPACRGQLLRQVGGACGSQAA